jgi:hypothetical protein
MVARAADTGYTAERPVARANEDLASNIGNLANRAVSMVQRYRNGIIPTPTADNPAPDDLRGARSETASVIDWALADFGFRWAPHAITRIGDEGNRPERRPMRQRGPSGSRPQPGILTPRHHRRLMSVTLQAQATAASPHSWAAAWQTPDPYTRCIVAACATAARSTTSSHRICTGRACWYGDV